MGKIFTAIGLMSGTSLDGIDCSIIQSDGEKKLAIIKNLFTKYDSNFREKINESIEKINSSKDLERYEKELAKLEEEITILHSKTIELILRDSNISKQNIDVVGFHGQTLYHSYKNKITKQLGNGSLLCQLTKLDTVFNFRKNDIENGGQGAPLTPIYHSLISQNLNIKNPVVFVNIGGISNLTYIENEKKIISFDTGPGNCLIDRYLQIKSNNKIQFDHNGELAFKGNVNQIILENYLNDPYYNLLPPKSLDIKDFNLSSIRGLSLENSIATLSELTAQTIYNAIIALEKKPQNTILRGGGREN